MSRSGTWLLAGALCLAHCSQPVSDTGFTGTWARDGEAASRSRIAFWRADDGYRFCVTRVGRDGRPEMNCDDHGTCFEYNGEKPYYEYRFRVFTRPDQPDALFVECQGRSLVGDETPVQYVDRFDLEPGGLVLWSRRVELNGREISTPVGGVRFAKLSDDPGR